MHAPRSQGEHVPVVDVCDGFSPDLIAQAMAQLWSIAGGRLEPVLDDDGCVRVCPITLDTLVDPVMISDGGIYEKASISQWLQTHECAPCTNVPLRHKQVLKLGSLRGVIESALHDQGTDSDRAFLVKATQKAEVTQQPSQDCHETLRTLVAAITAASLKIIGLQEAVSLAEKAAHELKSRIALWMAACIKARTCVFAARLHLAVLRQDANGQIAAAVTIQRRWLEFRRRRALREKRRKKRISKRARASTQRSQSSISGDTNLIATPSMEAQLHYGVEVGQFLTIVDMLEDFELSFNCSEKGLHMYSSDGVTLFLLWLGESALSNYRCEKPVSLRLDVQNLIAVLKPQSLGPVKLCWRSGSDVINVSRDAGKKKTISVDLKVLRIRPEVPEVEIPYQAYDVVVRLPRCTFGKLGLSTRGTLDCDVTVDASRDGISFRSPIGITICTPPELEVLQMRLPTTGTFWFPYWLGTFGHSKCVGDVVELAFGFDGCRTGTASLSVRYGFLKLKDTAHMQFYLAPTNAE